MEPWVFSPAKRLSFKRSYGWHRFQGLVYFTNNKVRFWKRILQCFQSLGQLWPMSIVLYQFHCVTPNIGFQDVNDVDSDAPTGINASNPGLIHQESYLWTFMKIQLTRLYNKTFSYQICKWVSNFFLDLLHDNIFVSQLDFIRYLQDR